MLSNEDITKLNNSKVCVVGCGGLGGYIIEMLARIGIGEITIVDGDVFSDNNLNRQLMAKENNLGKSKVEEAKKRVEVINSTIKINMLNQYIDLDNAKEILEGHEIVIDALDNIDTRIMLQKEAIKLNLPYIYGAIAGWYGQVSTIFPEDNTFDYIYKAKLEKGKEKELGNPSFTPAIVAGVEVSETIKVLLNKGECLRKKILYIDLLSNEYEIIEF